MVILHQHDGVVDLGLGGDGVREFLVHADVLRPVLLAEHRTHEGYVAERPKPLVGDAVIIAFEFFVGQPQPPHGIFGRPRRHADVITRIHGVAIGGAAAVRDPGATTRAHDRLERGDEAARRQLHFDFAIVVPVVDVGFAVGDHEHIHPGQFLVEQLRQRRRRPVDVNAFGEALLDPEIVDQGSQFRTHRERRARMAVGGRRAPHFLDRRAQRRGPSSDDCDDDGDTEQAEAEHRADEGERHIDLRFSRTTIRIGQVVQDQQMALGAGSRGHRKDRDVNAAPVLRNHARRVGGRARELVAVDRAGQQFGRVFELAVQRAIAERQNALVLGHTFEVRRQVDAGTGAEAGRDLIADRPEDEPRARLHILKRPAFDEHGSQRGERRHEDERRADCRCEKSSNGIAKNVL